jgi:prepilin-type processing-associated H-X9-DG protein
VKYFTKLSATTVFVVTRSARGAIAFADGHVLAELQQLIAVDVVDPTGAGDAFAAGFLKGLWAYGEENDSSDINNRQSSSVKWPSAAAIQQGIQWGCASGTASVQIRGASVPADYKTIMHKLELLK